jgi:hypothetical protein
MGRREGGGIGHLQHRGPQPYGDLPRSRRPQRFSQLIIASAHELSPNDYRAKWGLSREHPLTAPGYSDQRSGLAKQLASGVVHRAEAESPELKSRKQSKKRPRQQPTATT